MPAAPKQKSQVKWIDFVLSDEQTAHMKGEFKDWKAIAPLMEEMVGDGYKLSISYDAFNSCLACFVTPGPNDVQNLGCVLAGRGKSVFSAVRGAIYRHVFIFEKVWRETSARPIDD